MKLQSKILVLFICVLLCLCNTDKVQAASNSNDNQEASGPVVIVKDQLVITISYGYSQEARYGRYVSFIADIYNKGETFDGVVKATLLNTEQENVTYARKTSLPGGEKTQVTLQLPMNQYTEDINFSLDDSDKKTVVEEIIPLNIKNYGDSCMIGVLSDTPITLSYLQYFGNSIVFLNKDNLSSDYLSYDMLDTIVVDHFDLDSLEVDKIESIINFVEMGGNLVLGINEDTESNIELLEQYKVVKTENELSYVTDDNQNMKFSLFSDVEFTKMLTNIRDYESTRTSVLKQIEESKITMPTAGDMTYVGKSMLGTRAVTELKQQKLTKQVTQFTLTNADNVIERDKKRLYEQVSYGNGNILVFHFDLQNNDITEDKLALYDGCGDALYSSFYAEVAFQIKQNLSLMTKNRLDNELSGEGLDYRIQEISNRSEITNVPHVGIYIVILLIYIIVVGPVSFFILWKRKKQSKLWLVIPSISVVFFIIMYIAGTKTRIKKPYAGYLNVEYYDETLPDVQGVTFAYVGLNKKSSDAISFKGADTLKVGKNEYPSYYTVIYKPISDEHKFYDYTDESVSVIYNNEEVSAKLYDRSAFNTELFSGVYHKAYEPLVESDLTLTRQSLDGTITNCSNKTLYNAMLYLSGHYVDLGTMKTGDSINLSKCASTYMDSIDSILYTDNDIRKAWNVDEENITTAQTRKMQAYSYAFDRYMFQSQDPCIIASLDNISPVSPLHDVVKGEASYGESLVIEKLKLNESPSAETIVPNIDKFLNDSSMYTWYESTRFSYVNSIDFTYSIPKSDRVTELYLSDLFNNIDTETYNSDNCGRIYLYNCSTQKFDLIFDLFSEYGSRSIQGNELMKYFDSNNQITIRYESSNTNSDGFLVPVISCRKETINACN